MQFHARERHQDAGEVEHHAHAHDGQRAEALDQVAGEKAGREHADHVPFEHQRGVVERKTADLHGQRRGRHQQVHHAVAQRRAGRRHDEHRLAHDHRQRAAPIGVCGPGRHRREAHERHDHHGEQGHPRQRQVGAGKWHGQPVLGAHRQVGPQHRAGQPAGQDQRDRLLAKRRRAELGRRKAVELAVGAVITRDHGGGHQQPEVLVRRSPVAQQGRAQRHQQPDLERRLATEGALRARHQRRGQRAAHHIAHHRQRGHPAQGRQ